MAVKAVVSYRKIIRDLPFEVLEIEFDVTHVFLKIARRYNGLCTLDESSLVVKTI